MNIQAIFDVTVSFILAMVCLILILFLNDASVRVIAVTGMVTTVALLVAGWILTADDEEEDDWTSEWRF